MFSKQKSSAQALSPIAVSVHTLSNPELESRLKNLVQRERQLLHVILEHIKELDTRKVYLERAYSSLYGYLVKELGYSGSAAMRRIEAARLLKEVPLIGEKIQVGTLNLSQIGELSRSIKEKESTTGLKVTGLEKEALVLKIEGKTTFETQKELAVVLDIPVKEYEKQKMQKDESVRMELTLSKDQYQKLVACRDLAAHLLEQNQSDTSWASVFEVLAEQFLAKKSFSKKQVCGKRFISESQATSSARASERLDESIVQSEMNLSVDCVVQYAKQSQSQSQLKSESNLRKELVPLFTSGSELRCANKTLTEKTRKIILQRDVCCQYKDSKTGRQCRSTFGLQVDHRTSQWAGGNHSIENLQILCGRHNRFKYRQEASLSWKARG